MKELGTCLESVWPFKKPQLNQRPSDEAYQQGAEHKIIDSLKLNIDLCEMKSCLARGFPFVFGITIYPSFGQADATGVVPMPNASELSQPSGGSVLSN